MKWAFLIVLLLMVIAGALFTDGPKIRQKTPVPTTPLDQTPVAANPSLTQQQRYYFDIHNHTSEEIETLLKRARETYLAAPSSARDRVEIAMVIHGPDIRYFANDEYEQYKDIVDLAAELDRKGIVDMKICRTSADAHGIDTMAFPDFIEVVPYGPGELQALKESGYVQF